MSFSYDVTALSTSTVYQVRLKLGDTVESAATFQDEEIQFALDQHSDDVLLACIDCVVMILPRVAAKTDFTVGPYKEALSGNAYDYWSALLTELQKQANGYSSPIKLPPTAPSYFYYDMMGVDDPGSTGPFGCT